MAIAMPTNFASFPAKKTSTPRIIKIKGLRVKKKDIIGLGMTKLGKGVIWYSPALRRMRANSALDNEATFDKLLFTPVCSIGLP
jgi:beta-lactamase regulating signal transducer with metallopeptidase domain